MTKQKPWYHKGLRFTCTGCGDCCTGAPGNVWVNKEEIENLAAQVGLDVDEFEAKYVRRVRFRKSLRELANGDCVFLNHETRKCSVYDARPRQCRTWPFWGSNLRTSESWNETCDVCPGSGNGQLYQLEQIEESRQVMRI